ncbi:TIGR02186 family protein [Pelagibacteraceae bacterium]|nr:TIGR02186 family protein [Pelagibacteraceae bacterium]
MFKKFFIIIYVLIIQLLCTSSFALVIGSDQEEIYIDANFSGESLLVFGAFYSDPSQSRDSKSDILIEVVGPLEDVALRKKESYFGFWLNSKSILFNDIPGFYYLSSTSEISNEFLNKNQIGLLNYKRSEIDNNSLIESNLSEVKSITEQEEFYNALVRTKTSENLYKQVFDEIEIIDGNLFRSYIDIPNTVPVGEYNVNLYLIIDNQVTQKYSYNFMVTRVGIEEAIYSFSKNFPFFYGLISLIIAIIIGWSGSEIFKRFRKV